MKIKFKKINNSTFLIVIALVFLFVFDLLINRGIKLNALVRDDFSLWSSYIENSRSFLDFVLNTGANKFRPVFNLIIFGLFKLFGPNIWLFGIFNLLLNFLISVILFNMFRKISGNLYISACLCAVFMASRFAYYNISQVLGIMEATALLLAIFVVYYLWEYINQGNLISFVISFIFFTLLIFTHERYMGLMFLYLVALILTGVNRKNLLLLAASILPVALNLCLKIFILKIRAFDGTGGVPIQQSFNFKQFFEFILSSWMYIFGINAGPTYLNGISSKNVPLYINILIVLAIFCLLILLGVFVLSIYRDNKKTVLIRWKNIILFFSFIFSAILAASVTFRLEMRWLYAPFIGLLFLVAYISEVILSRRTFIKFCYILVFLWVSITIPVEIFYRKHYKNIYYWGDQSSGNLFYDVTVGKYGKGFWSKKVYLVWDGVTPLSIGNPNAFIKQFLPKGVYMDIQLISKVSDMPYIGNSEESLILKCDLLGKITEFKLGKILREGVLLNGWLGWENNKGHIWVAQSSEASFRTGENGKMVLEGFLPRSNLPNTIVFFINNGLVSKFDINESDVRLSIVTPKNSIIDLKILVDRVNSPIAAGVGPDVRELGLCVKDIRFE